MSLRQNLFLVGPMGVGKTTIGRQVAERFGARFIDLDEEIEARTGAEVAWIFDVEGEAGFRRRESELLAELVDLDNLVLSTGGGVVLSESNRQLLKKHGLVVYLQADVSQLLERTSKDKKRPLLQVEDREQVIRNLLRDRDPLYREVADLCFASGRQNPRAAADQLAKLIISKIP